ncbi:MAG TPA: family 16 glycosylhydrolase [Steroidobacteraceae bacterium]|nr:family 16 glycosylhydrolase [Steroidobacteraceae bacterium]
MTRNPSESRSSPASRAIVATVAGGLVLAMYTEALAARRGGGVVVVPLGSFIDRMTGYDTSRWMKADEWTNGSPFANAWRADHVTHDAAAGRMDIQLSDVEYLGMPFSSGEYRTKGFHGYGCYEARFKPIRQPGVVTSFFTFAGPYDNGGNGRHNEIDIEFLGFDTRRVQFNFWTNDDRYVQRNERTLTLGFDASVEFHNYGFRWFEGGIEWYVDGQRVDSFYDTRRTKTPKPSDSYQKIMMNVWPVDETAAGWAGPFQYEGPRVAQYEWVRYDQSSGCDFTSPGHQPQLASP